MNPSFKRVLYGSFVFLCLGLVLWYVVLTVLRSEYWDFNVFYSAAQSALSGENIYRTYGPYNLPYWYFPWVAWSFIPLAILPFATAKAIYTMLNIAGLFFLIMVAGRRLGAVFSPLTTLLIFAMGLLACWLLFRAGQVDFVLAAVAMGIALLIEAGRPLLAGLLFPVLLFKPHLLLVYLPAVIWKGGRRLLVPAATATIGLGLVAFFLVPGWPSHMLDALRQYGGRVDNTWEFATLPELLGSTENWSGTANLPATLLLLAIAALAVWKRRGLPAGPLLAFALSASLFCAPRAYSYNFPFLLPALLWISPTSELLTGLLWLGVGAISLAASFSTDAYLIVLGAFLGCILRANRIGTDARTEHAA